VLSRLAVVVRVDPEMIRVETLNGKSTSGKETKRSHMPQGVACVTSEY